MGDVDVSEMGVIMVVLGFRVMLIDVRGRMDKRVWYIFEMVSIESGVDRKEG